MKTSVIKLIVLPCNAVQRLPALLMIASIFLASCNKDDFSPDLSASAPWEPEIAFPLVYTELGISDLARVNDSSTTLIVDNNQFCTLIYQGEVLKVSAGQLASVPDQGSQNQFILNNSQILTLASSGQVQVSHAQDIGFSVSQGVEIDSMIMKNSRLVFDLSSDFQTNAEVRVTIPSLIKDGTIFSTLLPLNYSGPNPITAQMNVPLHGYHMDLTKGGTTSNTLEVNFVITFTGTGSGVSPSNSIQCNMLFQSMEYQVLYGYIGQQNIGNLRDSIEITIFNNAIGAGLFTIAEPKIRFDISNSLGIPFIARIAQLTALNANLTDFTVASGIPDPIPVLSPGINQIGQTMQTSFNLNNNNSNINALMNEHPRYMITESQVMTNPAGQTINFITDSSHITMDAHIELPLYGTANDFKIRDTVPFNYYDLDKLESLTLRMNIENWFPLETSIQLIFTDDNLIPLDTVFMPGEIVIPSGVVPVNSERVTIAGTKTHEHVFDRNRIDKILGARKILVQAAATTYQQGGPNVKIFNDYTLKLKIGAIVKLKIQ